MKKTAVVKMYGKEFVTHFMQAGVVSVFFYKSSIIMTIMGTAYGIYGLFCAKKNYETRQKQILTLQFREGLLGIAAALNAGYSIENSFCEARKDLELLYGNDSLLAQEFIAIEQKLALNISAEQALEEFSARWDTEDIRHFVQIFQTAKRTGGDIISITRTTAEKISQKLQVKREIDTIISGKRMEGRIMNGIPLGIILYFWICSPGFLDCFYTVSGRFVSTVLFLLYLAGIWWSRLIGNISV